MTERRRPLIGDQILLELERAHDGKSVYIDPCQVVCIEPDDDAYAVTCIRLYSLGGTIRVAGAPDEIALLVQQARQLISDVGIETMVEIVREELAGLEEKKSQLN